MVGVILLQIGTPDAPTPLPATQVAALRTGGPSALQPYLDAYPLGDKPTRVDLLAVSSERSLHLVQTRRPRECSASVAVSDAQSRAFSHSDARPVAVGMRYGQPSIAQALAELTSAGADRILAFPMYPQCAGATTGSSVEKLFEEVDGLRVVPSIRVVPPYYDDPAYIRALATLTRSRSPRRPRRRGSSAELPWPAEAVNR
jgi:ferrochelatase